jgi:hypothetical protein
MIALPIGREDHIFSVNDAANDGSSGGAKARLNHFIHESGAAGHTN